MSIELNPCVLIGTPADLRQMAASYLARKDIPVAFDTETTGLSFIDNRLVMLQFMQFSYAPVIVDVRHWSQGMLLGAGLILQELFDTCTIVGMNLSFDWKMVRSFTGAQIGACYDVMLAEQVIRGLGKTGGRAKGVEFNLKAIAGRYGLPVSKEERTIFIDMDQREDEWNAPFRQETLGYAAQDVQVLEAIYLKQSEILRETKLGHVCRLEKRALPAIASIEYNGIHINEAGWRAIIAEKEAQAKLLKSLALPSLLPALNASAHR